MYFLYRIASSNISWGVDFSVINAFFLSKIEQSTAPTKQAIIENKDYALRDFYLNESLQTMKVLEAARKDAGIKFGNE